MFAHDETGLAFSVLQLRTTAVTTAGEPVRISVRKVGSGRPSMSWPDSVDEALCFGWIDGVRKRIDDQSYLIRFTPRKAVRFGVP